MFKLILMKMQYVYMKYTARKDFGFNTSKNKSQKFMSADLSSASIQKEDSRFMFENM